MTRPPHLSIKRQVVEGRGHVTFTFNQEALGDLLSACEVQEPSELPEKILRDLCRRASHAETVRIMEELEKRFPGRTALVLNNEGNLNTLVPAPLVETTEDAGLCELRSDDVGFDLMMRLAPPADERLEQCCDPQFSPVEFDLRVIDELSDVEPAHNIGHSVLKMTLRPPDLAR